MTPTATRSWKTETRAIAQTRARELANDFLFEIERLMLSGAIPEEGANRATLFGVAMENIAERYIRNRKDPEYKNLRVF